MKVEAVDPRTPGLIRVATVNAAEETRIKLGFDGYPSYLDTWFDYDSVDVHPPGWCRRMGHPLEPPVGGAIRRGDCGTVGCSGRGHIDSTKYEFHITMATCPYTPGYRPIYLTKDRLNGADQTLLLGPLEAQKSIAERNVSPVNLDDEENSNSNSVMSGGSRGRGGSEEEEEEEVNVEVEEREGGNGAKRLKRTLQVSSKVPYSAYTRSPHPPAPLATPSPSPSPSPAPAPAISVTLDKKAQVRLDQLREDIIRSVYNTGSQSGVRGSMYHWPKNLEPLGLGGEREMKEDPAVWSKDEVVGFVKGIPGCDGAAGVFSDQQIDGFTFLLLSQPDLLHELGLKLGHATKIYNAILFLRQNTDKARTLLVQKLKPDEDSTKENANSSNDAENSTRPNRSSSRQTENVTNHIEHGENKLGGGDRGTKPNAKESQDIEANIQQPEDIQLKTEDLDIKDETIAQGSQDLTFDVDMNTGEDGVKSDEIKPETNQDTEMKLAETIEGDTPTSTETINTETHVDEVSQPAELKELEQDYEKTTQMISKPVEINFDQNMSEDIISDENTHDSGHTEGKDTTNDAKIDNIDASNEEQVEKSDELLVTKDDTTITENVSVDENNPKHVSDDVRMDVAAKDGDVNTSSLGENRTLKDKVEVNQETGMTKSQELKDKVQDSSSSKVSAQPTIPMDTE
ncbi:hypothetical protein WDU94_006241 [Cyamophila willieti]